MHTYLFVGEDLRAQIKTFEKDHGQSLVFPVEKIAEARDLIAFTQYGFSTQTTILIPNFDKASTEAQNSLLKLLEDGKKNTTFLLTAQNTGAITETILSRADVTYVNSEAKTKESFMKLTTGEKLSQTAKIRDRDKAKEFLHMLAQSADSQYTDEILKTIEAVERNGVIQLHLTNMVIHLGTS